MAAPWRVVDLFSGAGGMSYGFTSQPGFRVVGAADAQMGKPSSGAGTLGCNASYAANIGVTPVEIDLAAVEPGELRRRMGLRGDPTVLLACPPCTGFSRTLAQNHLVDDSRNSLVGRTADFVRELRPRILLMENARELVMGRFAGHLDRLRVDLHDLGYRTWAGTHFLDQFGLPQRRERAVLVAAADDLTLRTPDELWAGLTVDPKATHVRRAIWALPPVPAGAADPSDPMHVSPRLKSPVGARRLAAVPHDGGSWFQLLDRPDADDLLTPAMRDRALRRDFGSHPDVYGRLWWDRPAVTIKRECGHVGNGRYAHPEQDRLCTVREMAALQGFPSSYVFRGTSLSNMYRHIGDAVPPLFSHQLAALCRWMLSGRRPGPDRLVLPGTHLELGDVEVAAGPTAMPQLGFAPAAGPQLA